MSTAVLPFYHAYGLNIGIIALVQGYSLIVFDRFQEEVFLKSIPKYKVTILNIVPSIALFLTKTNDLNKYDMSSVVSILCGGAALSKDTEDILKGR